MTALMRYLVKEKHLSTTCAANLVITCLNEIYTFTKTPAESQFYSQDDIIRYFLEIDPQIFYDFVGD